MVTKIFLSSLINTSSVRQNVRRFLFTAMVIATIALGGCGNSANSPDSIARELITAFGHNNFDEAFSMLPVEQQVEWAREQMQRDMKRSQKSISSHGGITSVSFGQHEVLKNSPPQQNLWVPAGSGKSPSV